MKYSVEEIEKIIIDYCAKYNTETASSPSCRKKLFKSFKVNSREELIGINQLNTILNTVLELRKQLDSIDKSIEQEKACLNIINKYKDSKLKEIYYLKQLIKESPENTFYNKWNEAQKNYFNAGFQTINECQDFFFSYTNRNCTEINNEFVSIIKTTFDNSFYERKRNSQNLLATLLIDFLKRQNLKCFYDKDDIKCGDDIKHEIFGHCKSVFAFVQLVEEKIFEGNTENWCHQEFEEFTNWISKDFEFGIFDTKRHFFLLTYDPSIVIPVSRPSHYEKWIETIESKQYVILDRRDSLKNRKLVKEVATEIVNTRKKIIEHVIN